MYETTDQISSLNYAVEKQFAHELQPKINGMNVLLKDFNRKRYVVGFPL